MPDATTPAIVIIPLDLILLNDTNPRGYIDLAVVDAISASMSIEGQKTDIKVRRLEGDQWRVVGGDHRVLAARKLGWKTIRAEELKITPDQVFLEAYLDNQGQPMGWYADYMAIEALWNKTDHKKGSQKPIADRLMKSEAIVSKALKLMALLNAASRAAILEQFKNGADYELTQRAVYSLTGLATGQPDDQDRIWATLKVLIDLKLPEAKAKDLVKWVKAGNPPETYTGHKASKGPKLKPAPPSDEVLAKVAELGRQLGAAEARGEDTKPAQEQLNTLLESLKVESAKVEGQTVKLASREGLAQLGQAFKELFKSHANGHHQEPLAQSNGAPQLVASAQMPASKAKAKSKGSKTPYLLRVIAVKLKKFGKKLMKLPWHFLVNLSHRVCKKAAKLAVPEHYTHSGHSGHKGSSRGLTKDFTVMALFILHWAVYGVCFFIFWWLLLSWVISRFFPNLRPWVEWPFRFAARQAFIDFPGWAYAYALSNLLPALVAGGVLIWLFYLAHKAEPGRMKLLAILLVVGLYYGHRWSFQTPSPSNGNNHGPSPSADTLAQSSPAPIVDAVKKIVSISKPFQKPASTSTPVVTYQPSIAFNTAVSQADSSPVLTLYDPKLLEQEIAAVPKNAIVKAYPVSPDETMPGDLAVSRMQGVADADRYTLMIGDSKQKITSIAATATNLIIAYKNADGIGSILNNGGAVTVFYEDVLYIHSDEIDIPGKNPTTYFHCTLIGSGAKNALTFRCASANDQKHLVSTMEYFIRNSRLGRDTALAGMPYPTQGVRLNNDRVVEKLWANSPANLGGLQLGDHFWSVGKNTPDQQEKKVIEAGLSPNLGGLSSLPVTAFVASPADWDKAVIAARETGSGNTIHPRLRKVILGVEK